MSKTVDSFRSPGVDFRGAPFWSWNAKLEPDELRRQIRLMKEMGLGGFFMHARVGLDTDYLGKDWFDCVKACIDEAKKEGMNAWLYDEDRWPSGAAGGKVTKDEKYRMRYLELELTTDVAVKDSYLAVYLLKFDNDELIHYYRLDHLPQSITPHEKLAVMRVKLMETSPWFNNYAYLDTMNGEAVKAFIDVTYESYRREVGNEFGKTVPGIFTDEPSYQMMNWPKERCLWTDALPEHFKHLHNYDLLDLLPLLYFESKHYDFMSVRYDFVKTATDLFVNAFARQIGNWCEKNHLQFTGHMLYEDHLQAQTKFIGSAMRSYEFMQAPGMDILTENCYIFDVCKQLSSVARQFGRKWRLTETYGCTGWDFPLLGHKALGDWQAALGVNLRCQHLAWYSMEGQAKRDYPASIFYQSPWYKDYKYVEDYFARLGAVLTSGQEVRDIAVIHPVESMWCLFEPGEMDTPKVEKYNCEIIFLRNHLLTGKLDFDYADEDILGRYGKILDDEDDSQTKLQINLAHYRTVVIPSLITIRGNTLKLLADFHKSGGRVIAVGDAPARRDGRLSTIPSEVYANFEWAADPAELVKLLKNDARVQVWDANGQTIAPVLCNLTQNDESQFLFCCNLSDDLAMDASYAQKDVQHTPNFTIERTRAFDTATVRLKSARPGKIYELDLATGKIYKVPFRKTSGCYEWETNFAALGSRLFILEDSVIPEAEARIALRPVEQYKLDTDYGCELDEDNVVVLDEARYRIGGGKFSKMLFVDRIDDLVREHLKEPPRGGSMVQPYLRPKDQQFPCCPLELELDFAIEVMPGDDLFFALERPEYYRQITVNGHTLDLKPEGYWVDLSLQKLRVKREWLQNGNNIITLFCDYTAAMTGLESMFLLGKFGVRCEGNHSVLTALPRTLKVGDWGNQGLPNYSGNVTYIFPVSLLPAAGQSVKLKINDWRGAAVKVQVNDAPAQLLAWAPFEAELADRLTGRDTVKITVLGHRKNSHGPFRLKNMRPEWTGPEQFKMLEVETRQLTVCGLLEQPEVIISETV